MLRTVINIDTEKCDGCGLCATACHEGAIKMRDGKAFLAREDFCDGMGDCLPSCPAGAITFVERDVPAYNEAAVIAAQMAEAKMLAHANMPAGGCPGSAAKSIQREAVTEDAPTGTVRSELSQWPCQIKLVPPAAPYFAGADLLITADCCAFAYGAFHPEFIRGRICLIGCPKLDGVDYTEKLAAVMANNSINSVTVCRMEVPCCSGIDIAARRAADLSGKHLPVRTVIFSTDGQIVSDN